MYYNYSIMRTYYDELKNSAVFHLINECTLTYLQWMTQLGNDLHLCSFKQVLSD